ncbi:bombyxin B-10-like [Melanaphis sacchari]|uniref:bombyxin B-10-like n=1 Tax=Melanaphis sacchari TaxID=742174 RepID=UPI000DC1488B|nr:bombyxin B-10-like [Melanaphis sacchari]
MKLFIIISILMIESCLKTVVGLPVLDNEYYMNKMEQFCGQRLSNELSILCRGRYNEVRGSVHQRSKRGIVDECCSRPCSRHYMKINYCLPEMEESMMTDSPILSPIEEVDYIGYYFELLGRVLEPNNTD